jgi:hypothetical protein
MGSSRTTSIGNEIIHVKYGSIICFSPNELSSNAVRCGRTYMGIGMVDKISTSILSMLGLSILCLEVLLSQMANNENYAR